MTYLNDDQADWCRYLKSLPPEKKCECGWDLKGKCVNCNREQAREKEESGHESRER